MSAAETAESSPRLRKQPPQQLKDHTWKPGVCPNPYGRGGKPKGTAQERQFVDEPLEKRQLTLKDKWSLVAFRSLDKVLEATEPSAKKHVGPQTLQSWIAAAGTAQDKLDRGLEASTDLTIKVPTELQSSFQALIAIKIEPKTPQPVVSIPDMPNPDAVSARNSDGGTF